MHSIQNRSGFSIVEVLIALAITIMSISMAAEVVWSNYKTVTQGAMVTAVLQMAKQNIEALPVVLSGHQPITVNNQTSAHSTLTSKFVNDYVQMVTSDTTFDTASRSQTFALKTLYINPESLKEQALCNIAQYSWNNPSIISYALDKNFLKVSTSSNTPASLAIEQNKLYLALAGTGKKDDPVLFIFDIASSTMPMLEGSLDTASSTIAGLASIAMHNNIIYAASARAISAAKDFGQLQIIDASTSSRPQLLSNFKIPGVTGSSGQGVGNSVMYYNGIVYLGLTKTGSGPELSAINVDDPLHPKFLGGFMVGNAVNAIASYGTTMYVAHPTDSSGLPAEQLTVLDASNPENLLRIDGYHAADNQGKGKSLVWRGGHLFLGRTVTTSANPEMVIFDTQAGKQLVSSLVSTFKISNSVNAAIVSENILVIGDNYGLQFWDWPAEKSQGLINSLALPGDSTVAIACSNKTVYAISSSATLGGWLSIISSNS